MSRLTRRSRLPFGTDNFLAAFEGIEGGFAIGAGVVAGLSFTSVNRELLIIIMLISIIVNGFNSASVKYSSEHYLDELDGHEHHSPFRLYFLPALIQFLSYIVISIISILPLFLFANVPHGIIYSCLLTITILFWAGYWRASLLGMPRLRDAAETAGLGIGIIAIGALSGWIVHIALGA